MKGHPRLDKGGTLGPVRALLHDLAPVIRGFWARSSVYLRKGTARRAVNLVTLAKRIYSEFSEDRIPAVAGGITFFFLLAIFPAIACVVSLYSFFEDRSSLLEGLQMVSGFLPGGAILVISTELKRLIATKPAALDLTFALGFIVAVWSASGGIKSIIDGLNIAFETVETRGFLKLTIGTLLLTVVVVTLAAGVIYLSVTLQKLIASQHSTLLQTTYNILVWPLGFCICSSVISVIYRYGPDRVRTPWCWITWGSTFAALFWLLGTWLFTWYALHFGSYDRTYGVLGGAVGFLTWIWLSIVLLLTGAEIVCELDLKRSPKVNRPGSRARPPRKASTKLAD
ncbi:MAG: YihY/virulence factor BrkB family protein [Alphaproteobacteria bacterium]|nr:YihY/virulence factor BrkB family protein [Alphaproteobacteria bacterium]